MCALKGKILTISRNCLPPLIPCCKEDIVCRFAWNHTAVLYLILTWFTAVSMGHKFQAYSVLVWSLFPLQRPIHHSVIKRTYTFFHVHLLIFTCWYSCDVCQLRRAWCFLFHLLLCTEKATRLFICALGINNFWRSRDELVRNYCYDDKIENSRGVMGRWGTS